VGAGLRLRLTSLPQYYGYAVVSYPVAVYSLPY